MRVRRRGWELHVRFAQCLQRVKDTGGRTWGHVLVRPHPAIACLRLGHRSMYRHREGNVRAGIRTLRIVPPALRVGAVLVVRGRARRCSGRIGAGVWKVPHVVPCINVAVMGGGRPAGDQCIG